MQTTQTCLASREQHQNVSDEQFLQNYEHVPQISKDVILLAFQSKPNHTFHRTPMISDTTHSKRHVLLVPVMAQEPRRGGSTKLNNIIRTHVSLSGRGY